MASRDLLRALAPKDIEGGISRLEESLAELKADVDTALQAFFVKNRMARRRTALEPRIGPALPPGLVPASPAAFDPASTYACLTPSGGASTFACTPEFWSTIDQRSELADGRLVAAFDGNGDWQHWEMHPHGEELLVLLSGRMTTILEPRNPGAIGEGDSSEERVDLSPGLALVVPRGTWHRAEIPVPSRLLAITYGRGTEHRPR